MADQTFNRTPNGKFGAGNNANPKGRGKQLPDWFTEKGPDMLKRMLDIATGITEDEMFSPGKMQVEIAERIYGKAPQALEIVQDTNPIAEALLKLAEARTK